MEIQKISQRGRVVTFNNPYRTNSLILHTEYQIVICDTFCGPDSMKPIREFLQKEGATSKQLVIFNSHHHYDHIWGNCEFRDESIYAHISCNDLISEHGEKDLVEYADHMKGNVILTYPNQNFASSVLLDNGKISLFHTPGHTPDSSSCIDYEDGILFVGDNVESPFPYIYDADIDQFIATLIEYLSMEWNMLVTGHDPLMRESELIIKNIEYLENLRDWSICLDEMDKQSKGLHLPNLIVLVKNLQSEDINETIQQKTKEALKYLNTIDSSDKVIEYRSILNRI